MKPVESCKSRTLISSYHSHGGVVTAIFQRGLIKLNLLPTNLEKVHS